MSAPVDDRPRRQPAAQGWWLAGPALLVMAAVVLVPLGLALDASMHRRRLTGPDVYVGLDNYTGLLTSGHWWAAVFATLAVAGVIALLQVGLGFFIALTMHRSALVRIPLILVALIPFAAIPYAWTTGWFAAADGGYLTSWFGWDELDARGTLALIVLAETWRGVGLAAVICYVGLRHVSPRLLESARAEGATVVQRLTRVIAPAAVPALVIAVGIRVLDTVRLFDPALAARDYPGAEHPAILADLVFSSFVERGELGLASSAAVLTIVLTAGVVALGWAVGFGARRLGVRRSRGGEDAVT